MSKKIHNVGKNQVVQGDILVTPASKLPDKKYLRKRQSPLVAEGEATGHHHSFPVGTEVYEDTRDPFKLWAVLPEDAPLTHQEHEWVVVESPIVEIGLQRQNDLMVGITRAAD